MKKEARLLLILAVVGVLMAATGGGVTWWLMKPQADAAAQAEEEAPEAREYKYVSLEKVVVMLRGSTGEPLSHYLAMDLVFKTPVEHEKAIKQHLPLLRSIAVKAMSAYTMEKATLMTVDQFAADINAAYSARYTSERTPMPFVEAMIGKLIIE